MAPGFPLLTLSLSLVPPPTVADSPVPVAVQWAAVTACPRISSAPRFTPVAATAVCVGHRAGDAYLLTAAHALSKTDPRIYEYFTRRSYPKPARSVIGGEVLLRLDAADVALVRMPVGFDSPPVIRLAGPGQRPKQFPFPALSVGCPEGAPPTCRAERVVGKKLVRRPDGGVAFFWEVAVPPIGGMSGGPLMDADGRVIGLCTAGHEGRGYYVHLDEILFGLKKAGYDWLFDQPGK